MQAIYATLVATILLAGSVVLSEFRSVPRGAQVAAPTTAFIISGLRAENVTGTTAQIRWSTTLASDSVAKIGPDLLSTDVVFTQRCDGGEPTEFLLEHCVLATGLVPSSFYYVIAESRTAASELTQSAATFSTASAQFFPPPPTNPPPDTPPPAGSPPPAPPPSGSGVTVDLRVNNQTSWVYDGQVYRISYSSANAIYCGLSCNLTVGTCAGIEVAPNSSSYFESAWIGTYTLTCSNQHGNADTETVTIHPAAFTSPPPSPPTETTGPRVVLSANDKENLVIPVGGSYTIRWNSEGVSGSTCTMSYIANGAGTSGSHSVNANEAGQGVSGLVGSYTLTCSSKGGPIFKTINITTSSTAPPPPPTPPPATAPPTPPWTEPVQPKDFGSRILQTPPPAPPAAPPPTTAPIGKSLLEVKQSLDQLNQQETQLKQDVQTTVTTDAKAILGQAVEVQIKAYDKEERDKRLKELLEKIENKSETLSTTVSDAVKSTPDGLEPVLKSSLGEIELLIEDETGVDVDLSPSARAISSTVAQQAEDIRAAEEDFHARAGLDLYKDVDNDGISDFDEKFVYRTDPANAYTAGSVLTDGERVLLGFDPLKPTTDRVAVESPQIAGDVAEGLYEVHSIALETKAVPVYDAGTTTATGTVPAVVTRQELVFSGRALPNSFVTLYIFSTPIVVTVKADRAGEWSYALDTELEDGSHQLHVATVDTSGRILAKSPPVSFVKTAEAIEFTPLLAPVTPEADPLDVLSDNLMLVVGAVLVAFALISLAILGAWRKLPETVGT